MHEQYARLRYTARPGADRSRLPDRDYGGEYIQQAATTYDFSIRAATQKVRREQPHA